MSRAYHQRPSDLLGHGTSWFDEWAAFDLDQAVWLVILHEEEVASADPLLDLGGIEGVTSR